MLNKIEQPCLLTELCINFLYLPGALPIITSHICVPIEIFDLILPVPLSSMRLKFGSA